LVSPLNVLWRDTHHRPTPLVRRKNGDDAIRLFSCVKINRETRTVKIYFKNPAYPTTAFNTITPTSPTTETIVSITDQDRIVSLIDKLKYSLNIQKPPSLT
jgi:hypothetical protein